MFNEERLRALGVGHRFSGITGSVAPGATLNTTPPLAIWNPEDSRVAIVLKQLIVGYVSGTLPTGHFVYGYAAQKAAPTGGTEPTPQSSILIAGNVVPGGTPWPRVGRMFTGATIGAPTVYRPAMQIGAASDLMMVEDQNIVILPGVVLAISGVSTGGATPLVVFGPTWDEYKLG